MSPFAIIAIIISAVFLLIVFLTAPGRYRAYLDKFTNKYYAHRGLFNKENGIPENSIPAFAAAKANGFGVELDVQLTRDGKLVVFHDTSIKRMCGSDERVCDVSYTALSQYRLDGTEEKIPLLTEALEALGDAPLICEIKVVGSVHDVKKVCEKTAKQLSVYKGKYCIESFSPFAVRWFKKHKPDVIRGQLSGAFRNDKSVKGATAFCMRNLLVNFLGRPDFIAYDFSKTSAPGFNLVRMMRPGLFAWTIRSEEQCEIAAKKFDSIIFEGYLPDIK